MLGVVPNEKFIVVDGTVPNDGIAAFEAVLVVELSLVVTGADALDVTVTVGDVVLVVTSDGVKRELSFVVVVVVATSGLVVGVGALRSLVTTSGN